MTTHRTFTLLIFLLVTILAKAEYNGYHIEFDLHLKSGETVHGYQYVTGYISKSDSITLAEYIGSRKDFLLSNQFADGLGDYAYYQHRIKYTWEVSEDEVQFIFTLVNKRSIDTAAVMSVSIAEIIPYSYITGVASAHDWSDREWMAEKALNMKSFSGYFCSYAVFFHEWNDEMASIIAEIDTEMSKLDAEISQLEADLDYVDGSEYYEIEEEMERLIESLDEKVDTLLAPIYDYKVVVIASCTC